jgi:hypothetical protein
MLVIEVHATTAASGRDGWQADTHRLQRSDESNVRVPKSSRQGKFRATPPSEGVVGTQRGGIFAAPECIQRLRIDAG